MTKLKIPSDVRENLRLPLTWAFEAKPSLRVANLDRYLEDEICQNGKGDEAYWLYFGDERASKCTTSNHPNLWVHEPKGNNLLLGIAFNNKSTYDRLEWLLRNSKRLRDKLGQGDEWITQIYLRRKQNPKSPAAYEDYGDPILDQSNSGIILARWHDADDECKEREKKGQKYYPGPSVSLIQKEIPLEEKQFKEAFSFAYEVLQICLEDYRTVQF